MQACLCSGAYPNSKRLLSCTVNLTLMHSSSLLPVAGQLRVRDLPRVACQAQRPQQQQQDLQATYVDTTSNSPSSTSSSGRYEYSDPVNQFLGNFLPPARDVEAELSHIDWEAPKARGRSVEEIAALLSEKIAVSEWFVTGNIDPSLFSDSFSFKDDSVATTGLRSYAMGVRKLFDQATARAELIGVEPDAKRRLVVVTWRLEGRVNLPLRPTIPPYVVTTSLGLDADGLICSQLDEFQVPGWQLLAGALLGPWAGPQPAAPVEKLREQYQAARQSGGAQS